MLRNLKNMRLPEWLAGSRSIWRKRLGHRAAAINRHRRFKAFISYRHQKSSAFAENLELSIKSYAKPMWQRPMDVFRDEKYLVPGKPLDELIREALRRSEYLIYLASPEAAGSEWVTDELRQWCLELDRRDRLIIVLTQGEIAYDPLTKAIDWDRTNCLPPILEASIRKVPLFVDARDFADPATQKLDNSEFRRAINQIVAKLRNIDPIEMSGQEMVQHRRNLRLRNGLFAAVAASSVAFAVAASVAERNRREAVAQTREAERRESELLASTSRAASERGDHRMALKLALDGLPGSELNPARGLVAETAGALIEAVNANRLAHTVGNEQDWPRAVAVSPGGNLVVYGTDEGNVVFWRAEQHPRQIARLTFQDWITSVCLSADGKLVLVTSLDGDVAILRPDGGQLVMVRTGLRIETAAFSPDHKRYALGTREGIVQVRETTSGELIAELPRQKDRIRTVHFTPDGLKLAAAGDDNTARLWEVATRTKLEEFAHTGWVSAVDIDRSGKFLATASMDGTGAVWALAGSGPQLPLAVLKHTGPVDDIRFDAAGTRVVTASRDRTAKVWSVPDGRLLATLSHTQAVGTAIFLPDSLSVVTGSAEAVRLWRIDSSKEIAVLGRHKERDVVANIIATSRGMVLSTSSGGEVRLWRVEPENPAWMLDHGDAAASVGFRSDDAYLLSSSDDYTCRVWKLATGGLLSVIGTGSTIQSWCRWYRDGTNVVFSAFDMAGTLDVRGFSDGRKIASFAKQGAPVNAIAYDSQSQIIVTAALNDVWLWPEGAGGTKVQLGMLSEWVLNLWIDPRHRRAIAAAEDGTVAMWDLAPPYNRRDVVWRQDKLGRTAVSADGKQLAIMTSAGMIYLINLDTMGLEDQFEAGASFFAPIKFAPDGSAIAVASGDGTLWLWRRGHDPMKLSGHTQPIEALAFEPQGSRIASASRDGTVRLWDATSGDALAVLRDHEGRLQAVDFSHDGRWLASASDDGSIHVWCIERTLAEMQEKARRILRR